MPESLLPGDQPNPSPRGAVTQALIKTIGGAGYVVPLPARGSILLGVLGITLPSTLGDSVTLDALNLPNRDIGYGARLDVGFDPPRMIREFERGTFTFVPEPATLTLLVIGAAGVAFRRGAA